MSHMSENVNEMTCRILVTSDIHGHVYPTDYRSAEERNLGLAKIGAMVRKEREHSPELLLIDNGDLIQGTPLATYYLKNKLNSEIHPSVAVLNELKYDAAVPGNHEFNYGMGTLYQCMDDSDFPWLSAGITAQGKREPIFGKPYITRIIGKEMKVAVLGVTTHYIPNWENPAHIEELEFHDALETVKYWVSRIRQEEEPDLLIVSYHGGIERDLATGQAAERLTGENQGYAMCTEVEGIDVLITGHQHRLLSGEVNGVTIVQPGCNGQALGKITVDLIQRVNGTWAIRHKHAELIMTDESVKPDQTVMSLTQQLEEETQRWLDEPIGETIGDMTIESPLACRLCDHPFMEFVNRVQMEASEVNISNAALLSNESKGFGDVITMRDVLTNFMYPNTLTVLRLTGRDIREALEQSANYFILDSDGEVAVNPAYMEPKSQHYNYDMWEGIEYELDIVRPVGERVVKLEQEGVRIADEMEFDVVMNSYRAGGGGDYEMYKGKPIVKEIQFDMFELVAEYIFKRRVIPATCNNNWRVVKRDL
ncbi:Trifunctional nucleotide phosphoesterase protein YfkN precursor [compost metagenome]